MTLKEAEENKTAPSDGELLESCPWYEGDIYVKIRDACIHYAYDSVPDEKAAAEKVLINNLPTLIMIMEMQSEPDPDRLPALDQFLLSLAYNNRRAAPALAELAKEAIVDPVLKQAANRQLLAVPIGVAALSQPPAATTRHLVAA